MRRMTYLLPLLSLFFLLWPAAAKAELQLAGGKAPRSKLIGKWETHPRRGIMVGSSVSVGAIGYVNTAVPVLRGSFEFGGGITDRFTLGMSLGGTSYLGLDKGSFNGDVVGYRYFGRGAYIRGALGVASHVPTMAAVPVSPGFGGTVGFGYEFRLFKRVGMALAVDYDGRIRTDGRAGQAVLLGLRFTGFLNKKD